MTPATHTSAAERSPLDGAARRSPRSGRGPRHLLRWSMSWLLLPTGVACSQGEPLPELSADGRSDGTSNAPGSSDSEAETRSDEDDTSLGPVSDAATSLEYGADCDGYESKLRDCELLEGGRFACTSPRDAEERCAFECMSVASCNMLFQNVCSGIVSAPLERCLSACFGFTCESGDVIPNTWVCDGEGDCLDASDERDCSGFECDSGESLPAPLACDFQLDCADGSDERDCDAFACGSGELIPSWYACDLEFDCMDESDEQGCAYFECVATGEAIPPSWRCDQVEDCLDGSDEAGCARYSCR